MTGLIYLWVRGSNNNYFLVTTYMDKKDPTKLSSFFLLPLYNKSCLLFNIFYFMFNCEIGYNFYFLSDRVWISYCSSESTSWSFCWNVILSVASCMMMKQNVFSVFLNSVMYEMMTSSSAKRAFKRNQEHFDFGTGEARTDGRTETQCATHPPKSTNLSYIQMYKRIRRSCTASTRIYVKLTQECLWQKSRL